MKLIVKFIIFSALISNHIDHLSAASTYIVSLHAPYGIDTQNITCLYHGTPLPFKDHYCKLPEPGARYFFTLIITARLQFINQGSTVIINREPGISCAWFNCSLVYDNKDSYHWNIERVMDDEMPKRIPEHCSVIVMIPPQFITGLDDTEKGKSVIHLPKIMLKQDLTQEYLDLAIANIGSQLPDINCHCTSQNMCICRQNNTVVMAPENHG